MPSEEHKHAKNLKAAQKKGSSKNPLKAAQTALRELGLTQYILPEDFIFVGIAFSVAFLKDLLDLTLLGSLPGVGIVVSLFIAACMFMVGANKKMRRDAKAYVATNKFFIKRIGALLGGTLIESLVGIDFLPVETAMVIYLYRLVLQERRLRAEASEQSTAYAPA